MTIIKDLVVNCLQNRIFALSFTTKSLNMQKKCCCELLSESYLCIIVHNSCLILSDNISLWIAFRIVSLHYRSQHLGLLAKAAPCCELLSESYLCIIVHNHCLCLDCLTIVVNCFQNRIFALSFTTCSMPRCLCLCCELLSESYLCIIVHNLP